MKTIRHLITGVALVLALAVLGTDGASAQSGNLSGTVKTAWRRKPRLAHGGRQ